MQFITSDGFKLTQVGDEWTDGDLTFESDNNGRPLDRWGSRLFGEYSEEIQQGYDPCHACRLSPCPHYDTY